MTRSRRPRRPAFFSKRHPPAGSRPGTLVIAEQAVAPRIHVIQYSPDALTQHAVADVEALPDLMAQHAGMTWIDVQGLGDEATLRRIAELFSIHPIALEAIVNTPQRSRAEQYDTHQLYIGRMTRLRDQAAGSLDLDDRTVSIEQISLLIGDRWLLTFQETFGDVFDPIRRRLENAAAPIRNSGIDYLATALIDALLDGYFPVLERLGEELERLEDEAVRDPQPRTLQRIQVARQLMLRLRRGIGPQRDAINILLRGQTPFIRPEVTVHLRDCFSLCNQIYEVLENFREISSGLVNTYLSTVSHRTNEVMKVLTIVASIFIPLTFLAGIYGMNFDVMPELHFRWGYPVLLAVMGLLALALIGFFWLLGWLGGPGRGDS